MKTQSQSTILFPTDFSKVSLNALNFAIDLCKKENTALLLLNVIDSTIALFREEDKLEIEFLIKDLIKSSQSKLTKLKNKLISKNDIEVQISTLSGNTIEVIVKAVEKFNSCKIVMGTKITKDLFFRTNSFKIVEKTKIPLFTISKTAKLNEASNILFPFNEQFVTLKKADVVIKLAKLYNAKVVLLGIFKMDKNDKIQIIANNMKYIKNKFNYNGIPCEIHFNSHDDYSEGILKYCKLNKVDLITIANNVAITASETSIVKTSKTIINKSKIPVFTIPV